MKLNSSDGTQLTVEQLQEVTEKIESCFERIKNINNDGIQFDYCTCPELSHRVDRINDVMRKITKLVYQE